MSFLLRQVELLTIQILVDNNIEWFTKLPQGFTHEFPNKLQNHPPLDKVTGVPVMDLDNFCCGAHGLSILLTTEREGATYSLVFDTGPDARAFERNYASLDVAQRPLTIERIVLSHWHRDHSGAITTLVKLLKSQRDKKEEEKTASPSARECVLTVVDLHPDRPIARGIAPPPYDKVIARLPEDPTFAELEAAGARVELHREGHAVGDGAVWVSGEIPRVTDFESAGLRGAMRWYEEEENGKENEGGRGGEWRPEPDIMDERYLAVDVLGKGLVIFSACSHAGIINVVRDAITKFSRPIYMIIGGLHLAPSDMAPRIAPTVDFLSRRLRPAPAFVLPLHCSGFQAKVALEKAFGEGCVPAGVGVEIAVRGDPHGERHIFAPYVS